MLVCIVLRRNLIVGGKNMGYESLERESLITLRDAIKRYVYLESLITTGSQLVNDANYELGRIEAQLSCR